MATSKVSMVRRWIGTSEAWVRNLVDKAPEDRTIVAVVIMGSAIRDRGHRRSDVDLLVLYDQKRPKLRPPIEVDIRYQAAKGVEQLAKSGHEIVTWALKFGIAIYDPNDVWASLKNLTLAELKLPSATEARARADRSLTVCAEMLSLGDENAASDLILAALTQLVRAELIQGAVFPASRPELPGQLKQLEPNSALAKLLEDAMYSDRSAAELFATVSRLRAVA
jgi:predicted nucleotidyltransferase